MSTLLLVGTGLIGGSFALAARARGLFEHVVGRDVDPNALAEARARGVVDEVEPSETPDAVCIATPASSIPEYIGDAATRYPDAILFDVGSVKAPVIASLRARQTLPRRFVPCHPIVGSHMSGPGAARADLFEGRHVIVTPVPETDPTATERVASWWRTLGADVSERSAEEHDHILAATSHLPHLVAFALMDVLGDLEEETLRAMIGDGFRDFSRIAGANASVWSDILYENRAAVGHWARKLAARLTVDEDRDALARRLGRASERRKRLDD